MISIVWLSNLLLQNVFSEPAFKTDLQPISKLCADNTCLNKGQCVTVGASSFCVCQQYYTGKYCGEELTFEYSTLSANCHLFISETCLSKRLGHVIIGYGLLTTFLLLVSCFLLYMSCRNPYWLDELQSWLGVKFNRSRQLPDPKHLGYSDDEDMYCSDEDCINITPEYISNAHHSY